MSHKRKIPLACAALAAIHQLPITHDAMLKRPSGQSAGMSFEQAFLRLSQASTNLLPLESIPWN